MTTAVAQRVLEIEGLGAAYGETQVLWDVSLDVREGERVALIGSNCAGKSTFAAENSTCAACCCFVTPRPSHRERANAIMPAS